MAGTRLTAQGGKRGERICRKPVSGFKSPREGGGADPPPAYHRASSAVGGQRVPVDASAGDWVKVLTARVKVLTARLQGSPLVQQEPQERRP